MWGIGCGEMAGVRPCTAARLLSSLWGWAECGQRGVKVLRDAWGTICDCGTRKERREAEFAGLACRAQQPLEVFPCYTVSSNDVFHCIKRGTAIFVRLEILKPTITSKSEGNVLPTQNA